MDVALDGYGEENKEHVCILLKFPVFCNAVLQKGLSIVG